MQANIPPPLPLNPNSHSPPYCCDIPPYVCIYVQAINDVWTLLLCGTEPSERSSRAGFLTSLVAGVDAEEASRSLLDKIRRAAAAGGGGQASKATLVTLDGGGVGGGLLEAKPLEVLAAMKLFLNKCF